MATAQVERQEVKQETAIESRFVLQDEQIFGDETTRSITDLQILFQLKLADCVRLEKMGGLLNNFTIADAQEFRFLPKDCPAVGKRIYIVYTSGRIDRFQVIKKDIVRCFLRQKITGKNQLSKMDVMYEARVVGRTLAWSSKNSGKIALGCRSGKIARIFIRLDD